MRSIRSRSIRSTRLPNPFTPSRPLPHSAQSPARRRSALTLSQNAPLRTSHSHFSLPRPRAAGSGLPSELQPSLRAEHAYPPAPLRTTLHPTHQQRPIRETPCQSDWPGYCDLKSITSIEFPPLAGFPTPPEHPDCKWIFHQIQ